MNRATILRDALKDYMRVYKDPADFPFLECMVRGVNTNGRKEEQILITVDICADCGIHEDEYAFIDLQNKYVWINGRLGEERAYFETDETIQYIQRVVSNIKWITEV